MVDEKNVSYAQTTVRELKTNQTLPLTLYRNNQNGGEIFLSNFVFSENPNFAEYLRSGWQMSLSVAIDFTASNGKISDPKSLHYPGSITNEYEQAIIQVGNILQTYDHFKQFPAFGFGGIPKYLGETEVNHCFPLNGQFEQPEVNGVDGIVEAYRKHLRDIQFAGPTFFSSILDIFMDFANEGEELKTYFVLLILTDGNIHDMKETVELIVDASRLPCSIIIVGVGNNNFD